MAPITETAKLFFDSCEQGKGWDECKNYCTADATFSAQAEPLTPTSCNLMVTKFSI